MRKNILLIFLLVFYADSLFANNIVIDDMGRKVTVVKPFKNIISLYAAHTENLINLGIDKKKIVTDISYHDDIEKFLMAEPDLVLIRPMIDQGYKNLIRNIEKNGIVVLSFQPNTIAEMYVYLENLGKLTGKLTASYEMINKFKKEIVNLKVITNKIKNKKRVYFESIHSKMKTFSPDSMAIFALETAGGINIASDAVSARGTNIAEYGKERILSHSDKIDVYIAQVGTMNRSDIAIIKNEAGFKAIKAIRNNEIYLIDETIVSRPTLNLIEGINKISKILYPDIYGIKKL
ncbi:MAG: ABC transporter substrate-binding protein [Desulfobacterales bacterium]|nr:ABC transporter substrate-binding protein [Desulfobacterales bacterium]